MELFTWLHRFSVYFWRSWNGRADASKFDLGIAQSRTSYIDSLGNVVIVDHLSSIILVESLQQEYALAAIEHIEGLSHRV